MEQNLFLMNKDHKVLEMTYDDEIHAVMKIRTFHNIAYAPPGILDNKGLPNRKDLNDWWKGRAIPASRNHFKSNFPYLDDTRLLTERCMGLSLSDRYWVTDDPEHVKWVDVNFFDNSFTDDLGLVTIGSQVLSSEGSENLYSPNATLGGDLRKKWAIQNGERMLIKSGSGLFHQEPYNEAATTALHKRLLNNGDFVPYSLQGHHSICPNMLGPDEELVPMWDILKNSKKPNSMNDYQFCVMLCTETGLPEKNVIEHFEKMFTCDFIMANSDRHYRNFGLIRNVETLAYTRMAPIYDSGGCLWYDRESLRTPRDYEYRAKPFNPAGMDPEKQLKLFHNFEWFHEDVLNGFVDETRDILAKNPLMSADRRDAVLSGLSDNIETVQDYVRCESLVIGVAMQNEIVKESGETL